MANDYNLILELILKFFSKIFLYHLNYCFIQTVVIEIFILVNPIYEIFFLNYSQRYTECLIIQTIFTKIFDCYLKILI